MFNSESFSVHFPTSRVLCGHRVDEWLALIAGRVRGGGAGALRGVALLLGQLGQRGGFGLDLGVDLFGTDADLVVALLASGLIWLRLSP